MLIGLKKKFIFVANTKSGSTSIEKALDDHAEIRFSKTPQLKHISMYAVMAQHAEVFRQHDMRPRDFLRFGVMRDPVEWILSWFRYRKGNKVDAPLAEDMSFAAFWAQKDWNIQRADGSRYLQRDMFCAPDGRVLASVIIPYHQLGEGFGRVCDHLGVESDLPRINVSRVRDTGDISADLMAEMQDFYAEDYALFNQLDALNAAAWAKIEAEQG